MLNQFINCVSYILNIIKITATIDKFRATVGSHKAQDSFVSLRHINIEPQAQPAKVTPAFQNRFLKPSLIISEQSLLVLLF